jgi:2-polyprenyl-6-hydroxyphenyl methylase/3-demethylubiquinone-9 3-methyltransferase
MYQIQCKCCYSAANFLGNLDFHCGHENKVVTTERPYLHANDVPYYLCANCGFIFTNHMDNWSLADFKEKIYHSTDAFIAKEESRKTVSYRMGQNIAHFFQESKNEIRVLDYGSAGNPGNSGLAFVDQGFDLTSYEPYLSTDASELKHSQYDLIISNEVFEHCHDLVQVGNHMNKLLSRDGIIWIQTLLHPHPANVDVLKSWYITPSNGHISIFTLAAITLLFRGYGINIVQSPFNTHGVIGFKNLPRFKNTLFV